MGTELPQSMTLVRYLVQTASLRIESTTDYNRTPPTQNKWGSEKWTYPIFKWSITGLLWSGTSSLDTIQKPDKNIRFLTRFARHLFCYSKTGHKNVSGFQLSDFWIVGTVMIQILE